MISDAMVDLPADLEAEVCVAGGGPAGIVLALELARKGRSVILLEGGGVDDPGDGHTLYQAESSGRPYPVEGSRLRWLGGTTNHWGGWVKPLDAVDFMDKPFLDFPAWPFGLEELARWYERAAEWCDVSSAEYHSKASGVEDSGFVFELSEDRNFRNELFRFSPPTRFGVRYRDEIESLEHLDCRINLNAVSFEQTDDVVKTLLARTLDGSECRIRAKYFVLAMGGLENPRLLLAQDRVLGNESGLLGCCFMDHFGFRPGMILAHDGLRYRQFQFNDEALMPVIRPADDLIFSAGLGNTCIMLAAETPDSTLPTDYWHNPWLSGGEALQYSVQLINEPFPYSQSRVKLTDSRDRLGVPRIHLHWHLPESDFQRVFQLVELFARELGQHGLGRLQWTAREAIPEDTTPGLGYHHMGTTRMSADIHFGVVDPDCRVWNRDNLYIAGSSVFPTAGYSNPTLTICALSSRLAAHLGDRLERNS